MKFIFSKRVICFINFFIRIFVLELLLLVGTCSTIENPVNVIIQDIDGNTYGTIKIGSQVWMTENLRTTKYNDGTPIPNIKDSIAWISSLTPGYCFYNNTTNIDSIKKFGALYNWYTIETKKLSPTGWHIPTISEWKILKEYLVANGYNWDGTTEEDKIAKSLAAQTDWDTFELTPGAIGNDLRKNNKSNFNAIPSGNRYDVNGIFNGVGTGCTWWSSTEFNTFIVNTFSLINNTDYTHWAGDNKNRGNSIRLIKD